MSWQRRAADFGIEMFTVIRNFGPFDNGVRFILTSRFVCIQRRPYEIRHIFKVFKSSFLLNRKLVKRLLAKQTNMFSSFPKSTHRIPCG